MVRPLSEPLNPTHKPTPAKQVARMSPDGNPDGLRVIMENEGKLIEGFHINISNYIRFNTSKLEYYSPYGEDHPVITKNDQREGCGNPSGIERALRGCGLLAGSQWIATPFRLAMTIHGL